MGCTGRKPYIAPALTKLVPEVERDKAEHGRDKALIERDRLRTMLLWLGRLAQVHGPVAIVVGDDGAESKERKRVGVVQLPAGAEHGAPFIGNCEGGTLEDAITNYIDSLPTPHLVHLIDWGKSEESHQS